MSEAIDYEPSLHAFVEDLKAQVRKREYGALLIVASSTHTEFVLDLFPPWSCVQYEEQPDGSMGFRVKAKSSEGDSPRFESSLHVLLTIRDLALQKAAELIHISDAILEQIKDAGVEVDHRMGGAGTDGAIQ